jgi:hypothetical protein
MDYRVSLAMTQKSHRALFPLIAWHKALPRIGKALPLGRN